MVKLKKICFAVCVTMCIGANLSASYKDKIMGGGDPIWLVVNGEKLMLAEYLLSTHLTPVELKNMEDDFKMQHPPKNCCAVLVVAGIDPKAPADKGYVKTARADLVENGMVVGIHNKKQQLAIKWALFNEAKKAADKASFQK